MATLLDYQASIGSTTFGAPGTVVSDLETAPSYIGSIGLLIGDNVTIRVNLQGEIGVATPTAPAVIALMITRNSPDPTIPGGGAVIYMANYTLDTNTPKTISIHTSDVNPELNPVTPGQLSYCLFALNKSGGTIIRTGPESLTGTAMTNF